MVVLEIGDLEGPGALDVDISVVTRGRAYGRAREHLVGPSPVYKQYVNRRLKVRGYDVIGWQ